MPVVLSPYGCQVTELKLSNAQRRHATGIYENLTNEIGMEFTSITDRITISRSSRTVGCLNVPWGSVVTAAAAIDLGVHLVPIPQCGTFVPKSIDLRFTDHWPMLQHYTVLSRLPLQPLDIATLHCTTIQLAVFAKWSWYLIAFYTDCYDTNR